jgi:hypothetical protein
MGARRLLPAAALLIPRCAVDEQRLGQAKLPAVQTRDPTFNQSRESSGGSVLSRRVVGRPVGWFSSCRIG